MVGPKTRGLEDPSSPWEKDIDDMAQVRTTLRSSCGASSEELLLQQICDIGTRLVGARYGALGILNEKGNAIARFITSGIDDVTREAIGILPTGKGILGIPILKPEPFRLKDLRQDPHSIGFPAHHPPMRSFLGVPLRSKDKVCGNLYFTEKVGTNEFSLEDEKLAERFAELAVAALEREAVYEDAQRSRDFFRSIVDHSADAITITNANREIIFWNEGAHKLFGYTNEEVLGKNIGFLIPPEMRDEWSNEVTSHTASIFRSGKPYQFEGIRLHKNGTRIPVSVSLSPVFNKNGETIAISGITKDLTSIKLAEGSLLASERRYRDILENVQLISIGLDKVGSINFCNEFFLELTGWKKEEVMGKNWFDTFLPSEIREEVRHMFAQKTATGKIEPFFQNEIITRSGARRSISWNNTLVRDMEGIISGTISIGEDITIRRQAEERALRNQKLEALGRLSSGVAHDFNNALAIIHGASEILERLLKSSESSNDKLEYIDIIQKSAMSAAHTVKRLQDFARRREDRPVEWADVNTVIRDAAEMTKPQWRSAAHMEGKSIEVAVRPNASHSTVHGEEVELQEILINLIINAVDAMPEGGRITIATEDTPVGPRISVKDTGTGMPPHVRERALEPFFSTKGEHGTGMGLSMVFGIVKRYGGTLDIESQPGSGTTVSFVLPAVPITKKPKTPSPDSVTHQSADILLVEDEPDLARILEIMLEETGFEVAVVNKGSECVEALSKFSPDLVITDLGIPDIPGTEVARQIRSASPEVPIILLTGWDSEMNREKMAEAGIDLVVGKPVKKSDLLIAVSALLGDRGKS